VIEILQYIFATGALDINDIILNTVSGLIGVLIFAIIKKFIKK
jgi:glycopeptide antibiotics resistance protein